MLVCYLFQASTGYRMNVYPHDKFFYELSYGIPVSILIIPGSVGGTPLLLCDPFHEKPGKEIVLSIFECSRDLGYHQRPPTNVFKKIVCYFSCLLVLFFMVRSCLLYTSDAADER